MVCVFGLRVGVVGKGWEDLGVLGGGTRVNCFRAAHTALSFHCNRFDRFELEYSLLIECAPPTRSTCGRKQTRDVGIVPWVGLGLCSQGVDKPTTYECELRQ